MAHQPVQPSIGGEPAFLRRGSKLQDLKTELVGALGTPAHDRYTLALNRKLLSLKLREFRKRHQLTQEELGQRIGVRKKYISQLGCSPGKVTLDTLVKVFSALYITVSLTVEPEDQSPTTNEPQPRKTT